MRNTPYYSRRSGTKKNKAVTFDECKKLFLITYQEFARKSYFAENFGHYCESAGEIPGVLGPYIENVVYRAILKENLWPINEKIDLYTEEDFFDMAEFLYDNVSKPTDGNYHRWNDCGWHYETFDKIAGQTEFRVEFNKLLKIYKNGYELSKDGIILVLPEQGFETLLAAELPLNEDLSSIEQKVRHATEKFWRYKSSLSDRRDAIRDLADILEFLRPKVKAVINNKDEDDLFNIINNFDIRHHNQIQKISYDKAIWYSWMFYTFLATIHAAIRLIERKENN